MPNDPKQSRPQQGGQLPTQKAQPDPKLTAVPRESKRDDDPVRTAEVRHSKASEGHS